jgi:hypothetical protein
LAHIISISCKRVEFEVDGYILPYLVGKRGTVVKAFEQEYSVQMDITRGESTSSVVLLGLSEHVERAALRVSAIIEENRETEEQVLAPRHAVMYLYIHVSNVF